MPLNPQIPLMVQGPEMMSPYEIKQQKQQNTLNALKLEKAQAAQQQQENLNALLNQPGYDISNPANRAEIIRAGGGEILKQMSDARKADLANAKSQLDLMKTSATAVMANPTFENAQMQLSRFGQLTGEDVSDDLAQLQGIANNPEAIKQWASGYALEADKLLPQFEQFDLGGAMVQQGFDPVTGQAIGEEQRFEKSISPGQASQERLQTRQMNIQEAKNAQQSRQFDERMKVEREKLAAKIKKDETPVQNLSKKDVQKREAAFPKAKIALENAEIKMDQMADMLTRLRDHPGLDRITGFIEGSFVPDALQLTPEGRAAASLYNQIMAAGQFGELTEMRNASPTGGALGSVSNFEGQTLRESFASLARNQEPADFIEELNRKIEQVTGAKGKLREAFDLTYEYRDGEEQVKETVESDNSDDAARAWLKANPNHPKAEAVRRSLGE